ncbi:hypothetical protein K3718_21435 (plasmid) [Leisingera aquaemixtae]|uniref:Uncharacterized protein n=1 Tax=Leisingera aquaemixtae TaxID=1396826 RepID=A0ABY5WQW6_9RHOB|nr:hypothetical protein [Leisingera aquaemixtae]UWQ43938.1 hypothetical protein K3718_21435 [Leisingera aquaemixtae]
MDRFYQILAAFLASSAGAQEACIEPFHPDTEYLVDGGFTPEEMREEFRTYFSEVEDYLNCVNSSAARVRQDATSAAQDYNRVLDLHSVKPGRGTEQEPVPRVELSESGTLFLDYEAEWLQ